VGQARNLSAAKWRGWKLYANERESTQENPMKAPKPKCLTCRLVRATREAEIHPSQTSCLAVVSLAERHRNYDGVADACPVHSNHSDVIRIVQSAEYIAYSL
jgi:hypothetical protein